MGQQPVAAIAGAAAGIGRRTQSQWKREGLAEYVANIGLIRADSTAGLVSRLGVFDDDEAWSSTPGSARKGWDRIHYEAGLLVEFLIEVRGYALAGVAADSVTEESTLTELRAWAEPRRRRRFRLGSRSIP